MRTVVVGIADANQVDNLKTLPDRFTSSRHEDIDIIIHHDPTYSYRGDEIVSNYDILIEVGYLSPDQERLAVSPHHFEMIRLSKSTQYAILQKFINTGKYPGAHIAKRYSKTDVDHLHGSENLTKFLIKAPDGARGIGQAVAKVADIGTPQGLLVGLCRWVADNNIHDVDSNKAIDSTFSCKHGTVEISPGLSNFTNESLQVFGKNYEKLGFYEYLDNIETEYRIWTDYHSKPFIIGKRALTTHGSDYKQATYIDEFVEVDELPEGVLELIRDMELKQMSIDLYVLDDGRWGIFEYQQQTGITSVPIHTVIQWHKNLIEDLVDEYLSTLK